MDEKRVLLMPEKSIGLANKEWKEVALGQHHTIALDMDGKAKMPLINVSFRN